MMSGYNRKEYCQGPHNIVGVCVCVWIRIMMSGYNRKEYCQGPHNIVGRVA